MEHQMTNSKSFRLCIALPLLLTAAALAGPAHAQFPEKSINLVLSFPPAGASDILARAIG